MQLNLADLHDFVRGAAFLGTGGGGDPYIGRLLVQQEMESGGKVVIVDPLHVADDALVVPVAAMGAPAVIVERFPQVEGLILALRTLERRIGRKATALMPIEAGGINSTLPLVAGARAGLPIVNADGMGRAFPGLHMVTMGIYGITASPLVMSNDHGDTIVIEAGTNGRLERLARNAVVSMGSGAHIALYPMSGRDMKRTAVLGTMSLALGIGRAIQQARHSRTDPVAGLIDFLGNAANRRVCRVLFRGKIIDLVRETRAGFTSGRAVLSGLEGGEERFEVIFQNENLAAMRDGRTVAMVPDLICMLNDESAEPLTTETLRYGQRVKVVGVSVPAVMRSAEALATFGPRAFALGYDYTPLEELAA